MLVKVQDNVWILLAALTFVSIMSLIAWCLGFYRLPKGEKKRHIGVGSAAAAFGLYFFVQLILVPMGLIGWVYYQSGSVPEEIFGPLSQSDIGWINLFSILLSTTVVIILSIALGRNSRQEIWNFGSLNFWKHVKSALIGMVTWLLSYPWVVVVGQFVSICLILWRGEALPDVDQDMVHYLRSIADDRLLFTSSLAAVIVWVPLAEELLFRGFLQSWLSTFFPVSFAIALTSILFAFLHFSIGQGLLNWLLIPSLFVLSCFLGFVYERQQALIAPIFLHMTVNAISASMIFII